MTTQTAKIQSWILILFIISAIYDGILGLAFLSFPSALYSTFGVTPPNHWGYVQFPASLLIIFALMFFAIARDPLANRNLIPYGILLKFFYAAIVFGYWFTSGIPDMWKPFAIIDLIMGVLYIWAYIELSQVNTSQIENTNSVRIDEM